MCAKRGIIKDYGLFIIRAEFRANVKIADFHTLHFLKNAVCENLRFSHSRGIPRELLSLFFCFRKNMYHVFSKICDFSSLRLT